MMADPSTELTEWLRAEGGVLLTSEIQFRGCESSNVIGEAGEAVLSFPVLRRVWDVWILEEGAEERH